MEVLPNRLSDTITAYFNNNYTLQERQRVKYFSCDMYKGFTSVAKTCFPDAVICIDIFHVVKRLNEAINDIRTRIQDDLVEKQLLTSYTVLKGSRMLLLAKESNQKHHWKNKYQRKLLRVTTILDTFPDLKEAYTALQVFHFISDSEGFNLKRTQLTDWIKLYEVSEVPEVRSAVKTIKHWRGYIHNSWKYHKSNGPIEGLNNKVKILKRNAFGVHDFVSFRKRILLTCGAVSTPPAEIYTISPRKDK